MSPKPKLYKQIRAKVTNYVDKNTKDLVELLNSFEKVETIESRLAVLLPLDLPLVRIAKFNLVWQANTPARQKT